MKKNIAVAVCLLGLSSYALADDAATQQMVTSSSTDTSATVSGQDAADVANSAASTATPAVSSNANTTDGDSATAQSATTDANSTVSAAPSTQASTSPEVSTAQSDSAQSASADATAASSDSISHATNLDVGQPSTSSTTESHDTSTATNTDQSPVASDSSASSTTASTDQSTTSDSTTQAAATGKAVPSTGAAPAQTVAVADQKNPLKLLAAISKQLIDGLKANQSNLQGSSTFVNQLVDKTIVPYVDTDGIARFVLGRSGTPLWNSATQEQKNAFIDELKVLIVNTYSAALKSYTNEKILFYPVRGGIEGKTSVTVNSLIERSDGPRVAVVYKMQLVKDLWRVEDFSIEGISMAQSYQSQISALINDQTTLSSLTKILTEHNTQS